MSNDPRRPIFFASACGYAVLLVAIVAFGAISFRGLYTDVPARPISQQEDMVIADFERRYDAAYDAYRSFLGPSGLILALYLGTWTAAFGVWKKKYWYGVATLAAGGVLTVLGLALLPWVYFPLDQYAVPALWIISHTLTVSVSWLLVTAVGRTLTYGTITSAPAGS